MLKAEQDDLYLGVQTTFTNPDKRDDPLFLHFSGDDDVWVFINRKLVIRGRAGYVNAATATNTGYARGSVGIDLHLIW